MAFDITIDANACGNWAPWQFTRSDRAEAGKKIKDITIGLILPPPITGEAVDLIEPMVSTRFEMISSQARLRCLFRVITSSAVT